MMTMMLRVVLIVVSVITMTFMMRKIRQAKVQIEAAMFWVIMALILVVFAVVPGAADLCARLLGIYSTPNFLFQRHFLDQLPLLAFKLGYLDRHAKCFYDEQKDHKQE